MPFFAVIIPSYNRRDSLVKAIDSVLCQSFRDFELIVVDDGSSDGTEELADKYSEKIKYIYQKNSGVSAARNTGIAAACSPHITLLDSDDTWHKEKLISHRDFIDLNPGIKIHQTEDIWIRNGKRVNPGVRHIKPEGGIFIPSLELCLISPSSVCIDRTIFDRYGYFDQDLPACEDYDLWLRITPFEKTGLIREKLITRYAGHFDQLSSLYPGIDRFRIYSILKLLHNSGDTLQNSYRDAAVKTAVNKCGILLGGAAKRGNTPLAENLTRIINLLGSGNYRQTDYRSLLTIEARP